MNSIKIPGENDGIDYYKALILGQQVYSTVLYSYLCNVTQDYKLFRKNLRALPREELLCEYLQKFLPDTMQHDKKIITSYIEMGSQYCMQGYDAVQTAFQTLADKHFKNFLDLPLKERKFMSASVSPEKIDKLTLQFADKYALNYFLLRVALLTRSWMGENYMEHFGLIPAIPTKKAVEILKTGLTDWGQELLLLLALDYCTKNHLLDAVNLAAFDVMNPNLNQGDIHCQLEKLLSLDKFCLALFEASNVPLKVKLTDKDKRQIEYGLIAVFFLSNFEPDRKFVRYFNNTFRMFYNAENISMEINYRFDVLSYLSAFDLKVKTKYRHPLGSKIFRTTITIGNSKEAPKFIFESQSKEVANKEIWRIAYEKLIAPVKRFFESADEVVDKTAISFFIRNVCNMNMAFSTFFAGFGILLADNFSRIDPNICSKIMRKVRLYADTRTLSGFIKVVCKVNKEKYICVNENLYRYADWVQHIYDGKKSIHSADTSQLATIYDNVVNPTVQLQKKLISSDYRLVQKIYPLSDEIALYALKVNLDAYNYLYFVSSSVAEYYNKLKAEEVNLSDIGVLSASPSDGVTVSIMNSQKPFHLQIHQLTAHLRIKRIIIACGYCFASGMFLLQDTIQQALTVGVPLELYIGALQNYDESAPDNLITGIDKATVRLLNQYLTFKNFSLFTCSDRFYHGKLYVFEGEESSVVIVGSSNVSRSAFISNYELNVAFQISKGGDLLDKFILWTNQLRYYSKKIETLNENMFGNNEVKFDGSVLIKRVSVTSMIQRIRRLTNAEVQYRLNLWMSYEPDVIAEDLGILALPNYFVFVYSRYRLIVLESFEAGNAYFCLKSGESFENIINRISTFSKAEIFEFSRMTKRGYHVPNKFTLESNIRHYF